MLERGRVGQRWRDALGVVLPRDAELDGAAAGRALRRRRPRRLHAARRRRRPPGALVGAARRTDPRGRRRVRARARAARPLPPRHVGRRADRPHRGDLQRRVPAAAPHAARGRAAAAGDGARRRRLHRAWRSPAGAGAGDRQRPDRLPARGGAARDRARGLPLVRARDVAGAADGRPRHPLVGARDRLPRRHRGVAAEPGGALRGQHQRHGPPRRRPRPDPAHTARDGRAAARPPRGVRRAPRPLRRRPRRERGLGRRAPRGLRGADAEAGRGAWAAGAGAARPGAAARRAAARARPRRLRRRDPHRRLPPRLRPLGRRAGRVRRARLPAARGRPSRPQRRGCGSPACTSCAGAARRCSAGSATTPRWWPAGSPRPPSPPARSPRGSRARGTRAGARPRSRPTRRPSAGTPRGRRA